MNQPESLYMFTLAKMPVKESSSSGICIWCGCKNTKNVAHILSKKIIKTNKPNNYLKNSVCISCNSYFGNEVEDWLYKYSPIATLSAQWFHRGILQLKNLKYVPNFIWSERISEWVVINHSERPNFIGTQLILTSNEGLLFSHFDKTGKMSSMDAQAVYDVFWQAVKTNQYTTYLSDKLPQHFNSRLFVHKNKVIVIARDEQDRQKLINKITASGQNYVNDAKPVEGNGHTRFDFDTLHIHYKWSIKRYMKLCAKIGFEFLSLLEGSNYCLNQAFQLFKNQILHNKDYDSHVVPYQNGKGYRVNRFTAPGWLAYCEGENAPLGFPVLFTERKQCHKIFVYEVNGYILLKVELFDLEPCQLVIAKNMKLDYIYYAEYDFNNDQLEYYYCLKNLQIQSQEAFAQAVNMVKENEDILLQAYFYDFENQSVFASNS